jgi:hypothetical protein
LHAATNPRGGLSCTQTAIMKQFIIAALLITAALSFSACSKKDGLPGDVEQVWVLDRYDNAGNSIYRNATQLADDMPGFIFYKNGQFTKRENSGWCGTPPIVYTNYEGGRWTVPSANVYEINTRYWGGPETFRLQIISRNGNEITTKRL